jgi:hypothetical protein
MNIELESIAIDDMLSSVQNLSNELSNRIVFERKLLNMLCEEKTKSAGLDTQLNMALADNRNLSSRLDQTQTDVQKLIEFIQETFLTTGQQIVRNEEGGYEIYPEINN